MQKIFLCLVICTSVLLANFTRDYSTDTVLDNKRALMWQDNDVVFMLAWDDALKYCKDLEFANQTDWRLPTKEELDSLIDTKRKKPAIKKIFENTIEYRYWSATNRELLPKSKSAAWYVNFSYGQKDGYYKNERNCVRCVRVEE